MWSLVSCEHQNHHKNEQSSALTTFAKNESSKVFTVHATVTSLKIDVRQFNLILMTGELNQVILNRLWHLHARHQNWIMWVTRLRMKFSMPVSVATDWINPSLLTLSVQLQITSCLSVCEASRMTLQEGDSRSLSVHSFSVRGQLVLPGPSLSQWCCGRCACVSALSRVIAMCQRAWPSLTWGICRLVWVAWVTMFLGCPILSFPFLWASEMLAGILNTLQLCYWSLYIGIKVVLSWAY